MNKRHLYSSLLIGLILTTLPLIAMSPPQQSEKSATKREMIERLNEIHRRWYNMVENISSREEQSIFLQLDNDRDRDVFIRTFWLQRDPTPGTTANEYKEEIEERFKHVLHTFKRGTSRPAWQTDMGRIYMILGKPNSVNNMESAYVIYPAQIWYYYGDSGLNLPTYFTVMFYRPNNTPEWKLYNPATEDPRVLIVHSQGIGSEDYQTMFNTLHEFSPDVASAAFTMVPNEFQGGGLRPSWRSNFILSNIYESPQKKVNIQYATNFLKYKGYVDMESSHNFIENSNLVSVSRNERLGINFLNIALKPKSISVDFSKERDKYYYNFEMAISIKKGESFVYESRKNYDFYMNSQEVERLKAQGLVISDTLPIIPGEYTLMVYAKNTVGKEFTFFEKPIRVYPDSEMPFLATPLITTQLDEKDLTLLTPFQTEKKRLNIDTDKTFQVKEKPIVVVGAYNLTQDLWQKGTLEIEIKGLNERNPFSERFNLPLNSQAFNHNNHYSQSLSQDGLFSDYYQVTIKLLSEKKTVLHSQSADFSIAPHRNVPTPITSFKQARIENTALIYSILGDQHQNLGQHEKAIAFYEKSLAGDPGLTVARIKWLEALNSLGKHTQVMVESEQLKGDKDHQFEFHFIRGTALYGLKDYPNAQDELLAANKIYNSDVRVLNLLGVTFANQGNLAEGIKALEASLSLTPKQPQIEKILAEMKTKMASETKQK